VFPFFLGSAFLVRCETLTVISSGVLCCAPGNISLSARFAACITLLTYCLVVLSHYRGVCKSLALRFPNNRLVSVAMALRKHPSNHQTPSKFDVTDENLAPVSCSLHSLRVFLPTKLRDRAFQGQTPPRKRSFTAKCPDRVC
jgi:hypothetical protein